MQIIKKLVPEAVFNFFQPFYHYALSFLGALFYGFPSKRLIVIGVTGTKGKTTTCNLIAQILNLAGYKTGLSTTVNFRIGDNEWANRTKQTMLGRFQLQKLLRKMVKENCRYAVIETSSEGILQYRHRFIDYSVAVFTNLTPEHLERHGGFENYRSVKIKLFKRVAKKPSGIGVYNLDDENVGYFLEPRIAQQYVYTLHIRNPHLSIPNLNIVSRIKISPRGAAFLFNGEKFTMPLMGEMNVYNAAAAVTAALSLNIPINQIKRALAIVKAPAGRFEVIEKGQNFTVVIDYAHEPASLEAAYKTVSKIKNHKSKMICLLGAQGGGRDKWKRPKMGEIAAQYCDKIILTNEDPYDENPFSIIEDIEKGFSQIPKSPPTQTLRRAGKFQISKNYFKIIDRQEAIKRAISLAKKGDVVILTGKGGEVWMCVENGRKIPWDERKNAEEILTGMDR